MTLKLDTYEDRIRALLAGKKLHDRDALDETYVHIVNGQLVNRNGVSVVVAFHTDDWEEWQPPALTGWAAIDAMRAGNVLRCVDSACDYKIVGNRFLTRAGDEWMSPSMTIDGALSKKWTEVTP